MAASDDKSRVCMNRNEEIHEDSSESEAETEPVKSFHRRLSTHGEIKHAASTKEGFLMKQTWSFQRWRRRYFKLKGHTLYYAKDAKAVIFDEIDLTDLSFAECSIKNVNNSFQVITPYRRLVLAADSRREMEEWISALKAANSREFCEDGEPHDLLSGHHHWYATSHARPTYCNVCREALSGVTSHGLSCEVCKCKVHKRCAVKAINNCKWTTLASIGKDIIEDRDGNITMPHQWMEGNLPVSAKCAVCDRTCGSVLRLQDWRCLWCRATVHTACRPSHPVSCPLGPSRVSVVPPTALHSVGSDDAWEAVRPQGCSPLLVFVNSKSGENQGVKFLRRFKQLLNPAQVFDLISSGPGLGLGLFRHFDPFRILVCSGDGSVGWVLSEIDRLHMHKQCQVGVLPLGTGNDLARVLGWGSSCDHDAHLPQLLERYEKACTKMLDRWSIMTYERSISLTERKMSQVDASTSLAGLEDSVGHHLAKLLEDDACCGANTDTRLLTEAVRDLSLRVAELTTGQEELIETLDKRLRELLHTLETDLPDNATTLEEPTAKGVEEKCALEKQEKDFINTKEKSASSNSLNTMVPPAPSHEAVESSIGSVKTAVRHLVEATERAIANRSRHDSVGETKRYLDIPGPRRSMDTLKVSPTSGETSPGSNPGFTYLSISPLPDLRRDSTSSAGGEDLSSIPVPTAFADGRSLPDDSGFVPIAPVHPTTTTTHSTNPDDELATFIDDNGRLIETFNLLNLNSHSSLNRSKDSIGDSEELSRQLSSMDLKVPSHTAIRPLACSGDVLASDKDLEKQRSDSLTVEKTVRVKDIVDSLRNQEVLRDLKLNSLASSITSDSYKYSLLPEKIPEDGSNTLGFAEDCENSLRMLKMRQDAEVSKERGDSLLNVPFFRPGQTEHFPTSGRTDGGGPAQSDACDVDEEMVLTSSFDPERGEFTLKQVPSFESINEQSCCDTVEFVCACANIDRDVSGSDNLLAVDSYMVKSGSIMCLDSDIAHIDSPESSDPTLNSNLVLQSEVGDNISMLAESTVFDDTSSMLGINTSILVENGVLADQELSIGETSSSLETYNIVRRMSMLRDNEVALRAEIDRRLPSGAEIEDAAEADDDDHEVEMIKGCSLAQFSEGSDIGRRSFYRHVRSPRLKASSKTVAEGGSPTHRGDTNDPPNDSSLTLPEIVEDSKLDDTSSNGSSRLLVKPRNRSCSEGMAIIKDGSCLLGHDLADVINIHIQGSNGNLDSLHSSINMGIDVGGLESRQPSLAGEYVIKNEPSTEEDHKEFPAMISVVVDPPSPEAHPAPRRRVQLDESIFRRCSTGKLSPSCSVAGFARSPAATRRISNCSLLKAPDGPSLAQRSKSLTDTDHRRQLPIINPLVRLPMWPNVSGAGLISKVLLANADFLCAAASPLMDPDETLMEGYFERSVMNNYFGIGIDAKISLDFHQKREEHPEKCRSRAKNYMWYGVLGSKQWLQKTYKNLEQRVQLECDGQRIPLPSLQGIVILNIPSFMGGTNFWGGKKEDDCFLAPSFDDRILEVVAVFGSVQMAASRLINLQHHRIAQCQTIQITILGDEGVPVEVDGEAWIQPPGMIRIIHKNRMQMLCRNRALETSLKSWEEKQKHSMSSSLQSVSQVQSSQSEERLSPFSEDENQLLLSFIESATTLVKYVKLLTISHPSIEPELYQLAAATAAHMERVHPGGKIVEGPNLRPQVTDLVSGARQLYEETCSLLRDKGQQLKLREDLEGKLSAALGSTEMELRKCVTYDSVGLVHFQQPVVDEHDGGRRSRAGRGLSWLKFRRCHSSGSRGARDVAAWGVAEVGTWLDTLGVPEYAESFTRHDVRGRELLTLSRRDLKELGVTKVGHVKRILQGVKDLSM